VADAGPSHAGRYRRSDQLNRNPIYKTFDLLFLTTGQIFCAEQQRMRSILITGLTYGSDQWRMPVDHMPVGTAGQTGLTAIQAIKPSISYSSQLV